MLIDTQIDKLALAYLQSHGSKGYNEMLYAVLPGIKGPGPKSINYRPGLDPVAQGFELYNLPLYALSYPAPTDYERAYYAGNYQISNWDLFIINCPQIIDLMRSARKADGMPGYFSEIYIYQFVFSYDHYIIEQAYTLKDATIIYCQEDINKLALYTNIFCEEYSISSAGNGGSLEAHFKHVSAHLEYPER